MEANRVLGGGARRLLAIAFLAMLLVSGMQLGAHAGPTSTGGPWSHNSGPANCTFYGAHTRVDNRAYADTSSNGACMARRVRLCYTSSGSNQITGWVTSTGTANAVVRGPAGSTAVASEHRAQNSWSATWSSVRRPHGFC